MIRRAPGAGGRAGGRRRRGHQESFFEPVTNITNVSANISNDSVNINNNISFYCTVKTS